jgi:hypothetical protein
VTEATQPNAPVRLTLADAVLGLLLAFTGTRLLARLDAVSIPLLAMALAFTLLIAVLTGIVFGLFPPFQAPGLAFHDVLKVSTRGSSQGRGLNFRALHLPRTITSSQAAPFPA